MKNLLLDALIILVIAMIGYTIWYRNTIHPTDFLHLLAAIILFLVTAAYVFVVSKQAEDTKELANETKKLASQTRSGTNADIALKLTEIYSSPEMLEGMQALRNFQHKHEENFAEVFSKLRKTEYEKVKIEDHARRRYSHFFYRIRLLLDLGVLDEKYIRIIVHPDQVVFYFEVIVPMEKAIDPAYDARTEDTFREIFKM